MSNLIQQIQNKYIPDRVTKVDLDFLAFEEEMSNQEDLKLMLTPHGAKLANPHNSILLYVLGLTDEFDFKKARADTVGGSPADIDMDFDALDRHKAIQAAIDYWGEDNTARIGTFQTFKPRGIVDSWHRVWQKPRTDVVELKKMIPEDHSGKTAKLKDVFQAHPEIAETHTDFWNDAQHLEGMIKTDGIHAAGIVISHFPVSDVLPTRTKKDKIDRFHSKKITKTVTQYDMSETEDLGLIKYDFLGVENLSIIKEACSLINQYHGKTINPWSLPDHDERAYKLLEQGLVTGLFQVEGGGGMSDLIQRIKPRSISEISDVSSMYRPGPLQAGFHEQYITNKNNGYAPANQPPAVTEILKNSYWTLLYQEDVMNLCSALAGFTLLEADSIRRAMGKL